MAMKRIPIEGWMSLRDLRPHVPWERKAIEEGRGRRESHKLSFSLATEWKNARTTLPPNFKHHFSLQILGSYCCVGTLRLLVGISALQPVTLGIFHAQSRPRGVFIRLIIQVF